MTQLFPTLRQIPGQVGTMMAIGACYGVLFRVNVKLSASVFAIRPLVMGILFALGNPLFAGDLNIQSLKIYQVVHGIVAVAHVFLLKRLDVIGVVGAVALASLDILLISSRNALIQRLDHDFIVFD
jgi:hypothetical protein